MPRVMLAGERCILGTKRSVRALYAADHLVIVAEGEMPVGSTPDIVELPMSSGPPGFAFMRCLQWGTWPDAAVPFVHKEVFAVDGRPHHVLVEHAGGTDEVEVDVGDEELAAFVLTVPSDPLGPVPEATGYSRALSFDEAFADALLHLPPVDERDAGRTQRLTVVDTGALLGDGFNHLYVMVRRETV